jgi:prepilin-type N-terminal cleavage/methylation domain-containing protein
MGFRLQHDRLSPMFHVGTSVIFLFDRAIDKSPLASRLLADLQTNQRLIVKKQTNKGFTLIELLAALVVIAIMAALIIPMRMRSVRIMRAENAQALSQIEVLRASLTNAPQGTNTTLSLADVGVSVSTDGNMTYIDMPPTPRRYVSREADVLYIILLIKSFEREHLNVVVTGWQILDTEGQIEGVLLRHSPRQANVLAESLR